MKAARDIGDRDARHHAFVVAHFVQPVTFAHVAVDREWGPVPMRLHYLFSYFVRYSRRKRGFHCGKYSYA
jgi:hypothetical protein